MKNDKKEINIGSGRRTKRMGRKNEATKGKTEWKEKRGWN